MLEEFWFVLVAVLWVGFFVLEGFDFGVAALLPVIGGNDETDRRAVLGTIGPVWDANEVWLLTAGGAMFAAFPEWYASLFSGMYLALFLVLFSLIIRGVSLEYRGKASSAAGRAWCDRGIVIGGALPALLFGVAFANMVRGLEMTPEHDVTGGFLALLNPYALLGGVTMLLLCVLHGAVFLTLKTRGAVRSRARNVTRSLAAPTLVAFAAFVVWTVAVRGGIAGAAVGAAALLALGFAVLAWFGERDGLAFAGTAGAMALLVASWFAALYPDVLPARGMPDNSLTINAAASGHYTLTVMTWVAVLFTPVVLGYQAWSYWIFRRRLVGADLADLAGSHETG
ncbi:MULTISPECIES: cytochrome d ubiquinol oxidase subunit II [unclassified Frankia]|uniref:cytochrome d ubiquinol oxidase subunit II n=1 Tax=unclassified Frankia TaxID=2632575 RepID=UPI001EF6CADC|nr:MULTISPECIES: cytochrome d ubiquinol oxidase subunit II [unclassified Frankia]